MKPIGYRFRKFFYEGYWKLISLSWLFVKKERSRVFEENSFSIGIVTYIDRFETFFKPLIAHLALCFPSMEIIVVVNGYYNLEKQRRYLQEIKSFLDQFNQINIIEFEDPQSLSRLWNLAVIHAKNDKVLIMNDDLQIAPSLAHDIHRSKILDEDIALINRSWSHFFISKKICKEIGYFDERFPGVGNEDEDYECRLVERGIHIKTFKVRGIKNIVFKTSDFSYGPSTEIVNAKYVKANKIFFDSKWECSPNEKPGFNYVEILKSYVKLRPGMETPDFYKK